MKNYKLVNSKEVQEKAKKLGYKYACADDSVGCNVERFLFTQDVGYLRVISDLNTYNNSLCIEITQADFLALPEPILNGDYVLVKDKYGKRIGKVTWISDDQCELNSRHHRVLVSNCIKLTEQQMEASGLKE